MKKNTQTVVNLSVNPIEREFLDFTVVNLRRDYRDEKIIEGFNRPSTVGAEQNSKNVQIIRSIFKGTLCSSIILRDVSEDKLIKDRYGNIVKYIVIDGGHRLRAIKWYMSNNFEVDGYLFKDLPKDMRDNFENYKIPVQSVKCTSNQAQEIFQSVNKVTVVKPYSVIMTNEVSELCAFVRQQTSKQPIYGTECHPLFKTIYSDKTDSKESVYFVNQEVPNCHNIYDNFVWVIIHKCLQKGNFNSGESKTYDLLKKEEENNFELPTSVKNDVKKCLTDAHRLYDEWGKRFTNNLLGMFLIVWFDLYERSGGNFKTIDIEMFTKRFKKAFFTLTEENKKTFKYNDEDIQIKRFIENNAISFSKEKEQRIIADFFRKEMGNNHEDFGVCFLSKKRSRTKDEKERIAETQNNQCYIDFHFEGKCKQNGKPLKPNQMVYSHTKAYSEGGDEGVICCKDCNNKMGTSSMDDYTKGFRRKKISS